MVTDTNNVPLREAVVQIGARTYQVSKNMAYFKIRLLPGEYTLKFFCKGYIEQSMKVNVIDESITDFNVIMPKRRVDETKHQSYSEDPEPNVVNQVLTELNDKYSRLSILHTIGKSKEGIRIMCLEIGVENNYKRVGRPSIAFVAGISNGVPVTSKVLLHFATYLLEHYRKDTSITNYLDKYTIYVAPDLSQVSNNNESCSSFIMDDLRFPINDILTSEASTIINWFKKMNAMLAVNLNIGSQHVEIPFAGNYGKMPDYVYKTDDEVILQELGSLYTKNNIHMTSKNSNCNQDLNVNSNGVIHAGLGIGGKREDSLIDYLYLNTSTLMIDAYVTCCDTDDSKNVWEDNKASLLAMVEKLRDGVKGYVLNKNNEPTENAVLSHNKSAHHIKSGINGAYWILLQPGTHVIIAQAPGYIQQTKVFTTPDVHNILNLIFKLRYNDTFLGMQRMVFIILISKILDTV